MKTNNVVRLSKITIPAHKNNLDVIFDFDCKIICWIVLRQLKQEKKIINIKSYMNNIDKENGYNQYINLIKKLENNYVYFNLGELNRNFYKYELWSYDTIIEKTFKSLYYNCDYSDHKDLMNKLNIYFKYIPFLRETIKPYFSFDYSFGYCCSDCDGSYSNYVRTKFEQNIDDILLSFSKIKFI